MKPEKPNQWLDKELAKTHALLKAATESMARVTAAAVAIDKDGAK